MIQIDQKSAIFVKTYPSHAMAAEALRRSRLLRAEGVATPAAAAGPTAASLSFTRINGESGAELVGQGDLAELLAPLRTLRRLPKESLPRHDPFKRIRPRLACGGFPGVSTRLLKRLAEGLPQDGGVIHGDFHPGQVIRDHRGTVWIVDLDDMAVGPPEADLGNLAANLATRLVASSEPLTTSLSRWKKRITSAWAEPCNPTYLERYMRIAALRRALKLQELGRANLLPGLLPLLSAS